MHNFDFVFYFFLFLFWFSKFLENEIYIHIVMSLLIKSSH